MCMLDGQVKIKNYNDELIGWVAIMVFNKSRISLFSDLGDGAYLYSSTIT